VGRKVLWRKAGEFLGEKFFCKRARSLVASSTDFLPLR
jgi:hypothetical protein